MKQKGRNVAASVRRLVADFRKDLRNAAVQDVLSLQKMLIRGIKCVENDLREYFRISLCQSRMQAPRRWSHSCQWRDGKRSPN